MAGNYVTLVDNNSAPLGGPTNPLVSTAVATAGGLSVNRLRTGPTVSVKASAGQVYGFNLYNTVAALRYLHIYNKASAPTLNTDTPVATFVLPASSLVNVEISNGLQLSTGFAFAITTDNAAVPVTGGTSGDVVGTLLYN